MSPEVRDIVWGAGVVYVGMTTVLILVLLAATSMICIAISRAAARLSTAADRLTKAAEAATPHPWERSTTR